MLSEAPGSMTKLFFREAVARAVAEEMRRDPLMLLLGQDVGEFGGPYKEFLGLFQEFGPDRIRDTPISEAAMIGVAVGASAAGVRTLVSITYMDFLMLGLDPLINYAAKARYKTAGQIRAPVVVKTTSGAKGQGVAHSQCVESWLMNVPGLKVVAPSTPADAYGLLKSALREEGPVLYVDHKRLFPIAGQVPVAETPIPLGQAALRRAGKDVTVTAHSYMTHVAMDAARRLASEGVECEVIDLRSLAPLDIETVARSASRTGRLVTLEEGQLTCGSGAEIAFQTRDRCGFVKVARVGPLPAPVSSNPALEAACLPNAARVVEAVQRVMKV